MSVPIIDTVLQMGRDAINKIWPDPIKRAEEMRKLEELHQKGDLARLEADVQIILAQLKINEKEAEHKSMFVAGWRPAVGWVCVTILAFNYIGIYILEYVHALAEIQHPVPERFDMAELWPVLLGMLGLGGMRTYEKGKNKASNSLK